MGVQLRTYKKRIQATKSIKKITKAMELIAATKIPKSQSVIKSYEHYHTLFNSTFIQWQSLVKINIKNVKDNSFIIVITSDKGLNGNYNHLILNELAYLNNNSKNDKQLLIIGNKGKSYCKYRNMKNTEYMTFNSLYANLNEGASNLSHTIYDLYIKGLIKDIRIIYMHSYSFAIQKINNKIIFPLTEGKINKTLASPIFTDGHKTLYKKLLEQYIQNSIYYSIINAFLAENIMRQKSMQKASDNADDIITKCVKLANKARQSKITSEVNEIINGSNAVQ